MRNALLSRIEPVAAVRTSADDLPQASSVVAVASAAKSPEDLVNGACAACHAAGVAGAPKTGDEAVWAERRELGLEALVASVINGKGSMPARGGSTYTDKEITQAVQHLAMFEVTEESSSDASDASDASESTESAATQSEDTASSETATTETSTAAAAITAAVMGVEPEGLTDQIKMSVNGVCAGCHIAGVANAPKFGDKEAWQPRLEKGLDALVASVANGLNVMPARGGTTLNDEELRIAVQYMLSK